MFHSLAARRCTSMSSGIRSTGCLIRLYTAGSSDQKPATIDSRLKADLKAAMKSKNKSQLSVVKSVLSEILYFEKQPSTGATFSRDSDSDVATVIQKLIKQRNESILSFKEGGRDDLAQAEEADLALLKEYLPKQLSDEEILEKVRGVVEKLGVKGIKAMGTVMKEVGIGSDQAPKSKVAEAVKKVLSE